MATLKLGNKVVATQTGTNNPVINSATTFAGTVSNSATFPSGKFIALKGITHSEGSTTASGTDALLLSISVTLTGYTNYLLYAWAHTAITENSNHSNVSRLKIQLDRLNAIGGLDAIVPSEGIVFKYKGKTYKFTGAFAPINQITGLMTF